MIRPTIFLDHNKTINVKQSYITNPKDIHLIPHTATTINKLKTTDYTIILITNQTTIAKNLLTKIKLNNIHKHLKSLLNHSNVFLDTIYSYPHHSQFPSSSSDPKCSYRKPNPNIILQTTHNLDLNLNKSFIINNNLNDLQTKWRTKYRTTLVLTNHKEHTHLEANNENLQRVDLIAESLADIKK